MMKSDTTPVGEQRQRAMRRAMIGAGVMALLLVALLFIKDEEQPPVPAVTENASSPVVQAPVQIAADAGAPAAPQRADLAPPVTAETSPAPTLEAPAAPDAAAAPAMADASVAAAQPDATAPPAEEPAIAEPVMAAMTAPQPRRFPPPPPGNGYMVQLGVFTDTENAATLLLELAAAGHPAYLQSRVVLGPYPNKAAAQQAQDKIRRERKLDGMIVPPRKP